MAQDYRDTVIHKEKPEKRTKYGHCTPRWWEVEPEEMAQAVVDVGASLVNTSGNRLEANVQFARLYENCSRLDGGGL